MCFQWAPFFLFLPAFTTDSLSLLEDFITIFWGSFTFGFFSWGLILPFFLCTIWDWLECLDVSVITLQRMSDITESLALAR